MHAKARDPLNDLVAPLAVAEGIEHRRHRAQVLQVGAEKQQVAGNAEHFRHHHPNRLHPVRHLDAGQLFGRQHIGQVIHHPAGVVNAVGVGDEAMPGLALGHFLRTPVVIADIRDAVDNFLTIQLQHNTEGTMGGGMVGTKVQEHELRAVPLSGHAPGFGYELEGVLLGLLALQRERVGVEFRCPGGVILAQGVSRPGGRHQNAFKMRVAGKADAEHVPDFPLIPVGRRKHPGSGGDAQVFLGQSHFQHDVPIAGNGHQLIEDGEISVRQALAMAAQPLVRGRQVVQQIEGRIQAFQIAQDIGQCRPRHPEHRHAGAGLLAVQHSLAKIPLQGFDQLNVGIVCATAHARGLTPGNQL